MTNPRGICRTGRRCGWADADKDKLFAYSLSDGSRDDTKDIDLVGANGNPTGIWSDRTTVWVADSLADKLFAYTFDGTRDTGKDIALLGVNGFSGGHLVRCDDHLGDGRVRRLYLRLHAGRRVAGPRKGYRSRSQLLWFIRHMV